MKINPFKFGTVVDDPFFTDRTVELERVKEILASNNHLVIISPRRFGKTSLIRKAVRESDRKVLMMDLQLINSPEDFAAQYLRRIYRLFPLERIRQGILKFRIIPVVSLNPATNEVDIAFEPGAPPHPYIEDVLNLLEKLASPGHRPIVILDEFQEIGRLDPAMGNMLRAVMQNHTRINYVFLGSQESMMREIFEKKKSPFYHFGIVMSLPKIGQEAFYEYVSDRLKGMTKNYRAISVSVVSFTGGHPYYTQQLAFAVWNILHRNPAAPDPVSEAIEETITMHDLDYERLWATFLNTDRKILIGLTRNETPTLSAKFAKMVRIHAQSTIFSGLKRLVAKGYLIQTGNLYDFDDPFFRQWIIRRRETY